MRFFFSCLLATRFALLAVAGQDAAPSSHFVFDDNFAGDILINEVRVPKDGEAKYTYYETIGWRGKAAGYGGLQAHPRGHIYLFSIWDHEEHKGPIKEVYRGPGTTTQKFGGEGTGLKSWNFDLGWKTDTWYTFVARAWPMKDHTFYGCWTRSGESKEWTHLITMDVAVEKAFFQGGNDAFLEDWLETGKNARTTHLRGGWRRKLDRQSGSGWHPVGSGRYSVNSWDLDPGKRSFNFKTNWNGGVAKDESGEFYFMTAGGADTRPTATNPSKHAIARTGPKPAYQPMRVERASATLGKNGNIHVTWENDPKTLPQFRVAMELYDNPTGEGKALEAQQWFEPHRRQADLKLPDPRPPSNELFVLVRFEDLLGHETEPLSLPVKQP